MYKQAITISIALAVLCTTYLLAFKELPNTLWLLLISIAMFITSAVLGFFSISNLSAHVKIGDYSSYDEGSKWHEDSRRLVIIAMQGLFFAAIIAAVIFAVVNLEHFYREKVSKADKSLESFVEDSVNKNVERIYSQKIKSRFEKKIDEIDTEIDNKLDKALDDKISKIGKKEIIDKAYERLKQEIKKKKQNSQKKRKHRP